MHHCAGSFKTKAELKRAVANGKDPFFFDSSIFNPVSMYSSDIPVGEVLYIVGPSEYRRNWYAQVTRDRNGKVKVS